MKKIFFAVIIMLISASAFAQQTGKLADQYIIIKNALVNGDSKTAAEAAATFQQTIADDADFALKNDLLKATGELAKAASLDKQRAAFNEVSTTFWKLVKTAGKIETPLYYQYCPMKKAYWVSKEKDIKNPYYGSSMLTCGKVVETN
jgi:hypothetical protein